MNRKRLVVAVLTSLMLLALLVGGTFAVFTDTESAHPKFKAGTINIALSGEAYTTTFLNPTGFDDWKPGDHEDFELNIKNTGSNKAWIQIYIYETPPWTDGRANFWDAATWEVEHTGDWNKWVLSPDENMQVKLVVDFPQSAGNEFQGAQGDLAILVVGKQWRNKLQDGYSCVALEDKPKPDYVPILDNDLEGILCYKVEGSNLLVDLNGYGLTPNAYYQLDLTGGDKNNPIDGACTAQDTRFAGMSGDLYVAGYWNWGTVLEAVCNPSNGGEGVWNYAGVYGGVKADALGRISFGGSFTMPAGAYQGVGAHVKEIQKNGAPAGEADLPGNGWPVILSEMDYISFTVPTP